MNIFVTDPSPTVSAQVLPDKHIVKMPLESCQMLAIVCSEKWGHGYGEIHKKDGEPYKTDKGAFRGHPCTIWANESNINAWWLVAHAMALCEEYTHRYGNVHSCESTGIKKMSEEALQEQIIQQIEVLVEELGGSMCHSVRCNSVGRQSKVIEIEYNVEG